MRALLIAAALWSAAGVAKRTNADPPAERPEAAIELRWRYKGLAEGMELRELKPGVELPLWETGVADTMEKSPAAALIEGAVVKVRPGAEKLFLLVYRNKTANDVHFFAAPHQSAPAESSLGSQFWCLCLDHVYTVPAGKTWFRVVKLSLRGAFEGKPLSITHDLIARDAPDNW